MAAFDLIELSLDPLDVTPTLEDEFTSTVVKNEIDNLDDIEHVKIASKQLVKRLAVDEKNVRIQRFEG